MENRQNTIFSANDYNIQGNEQYSASGYVKAGHQIEFTARAQDAVRMYIKSSDGKILDSREDVSSARLGITAPMDDTYYFIVFNPHNGFYGIGKQAVVLYSASATENWQELTTKYQDTTEPVTGVRTVTKTVSIIQMMTGNK